MNGVVSLLEDKYYRIVEELWAKLERDFGVRGVYVTPYPHFSYQIAPHYDIESLESALSEFASTVKPFRIRTSGLGIFTGPSPVLYIPVVRTQELNHFHEALWHKISPFGIGISDYHLPENWMPHITIGFGDLSKEKLGLILQSLGKMDFSWEMTIDNLAFISDEGSKQELKSRFDFIGHKDFVPTASPHRENNG